MLEESWIAIPVLENPEILEVGYYDGEPPLYDDATNRNKPIIKSKMIELRPMTGNDSNSNEKIKSNTIEPNQIKYEWTRLFELDKEIKFNGKSKYKVVESRQIESNILSVYNSINHNQVRLDMVAKSKATAKPTSIKCWVKDI